MELKLSELKPGQIVWVCDYRHNDIFKKPIRHVKPTEVMVVSNDELPPNKTVYYSNVHFRPIVNGKVKKQIIAPFDNTGYRSYTGICINIFSNQCECNNKFNKQCISILKEIEKERKATVVKFDEMNKKINDEMF